MHSENMKLRGRATSGDNLPVGLQVKVNFLSRFGTSLLPIGMDFIQVEYNSARYFETNILEIKGDVDLSTVSSLKVVVEKYIDDNETIIEENLPYTDATLKVRELSDLKEKYGADAVCQTSNNNGVILCNCGRIIPAGSKSCEICQRSNAYWSPDGQSIDNLVESLHNLNSAKEAVDCIAKRYDKGNGQLAEYSRAMIQAIELEQTTGKNMKDYAIRKYQELFGIE